MWSYNIPAGSAKIHYDSLTGYFLAYRDAEYFGSFLTPQLAADALRHSPEESVYTIPADLGQWKSEPINVWWE